uniref:Uncharacterized protein n=1 Tax=Sipha flava TaxID=143950 RepID=A0A2S2QLH0_9HEMI
MCTIVCRACRRKTRRSCHPYTERVCAWSRLAAEPMEFDISPLHGRVLNSLDKTTHRLYTTTLLLCTIASTDLIIASVTWTMTFHYISIAEPVLPFPVEPP